MSRLAAVHPRNRNEEEFPVPRSLPASYHLVRPAGAALLGVAYLVGSVLVGIGPAHAGHEPLGAYLLSIVLFFSASAGTAMLVNGHHLFDCVTVSRQWIMQTPPPSFRHHSDAMLRVPERDRDHQDADAGTCTG
jgi:hypothetical protein